MNASSLPSGDTQERVCCCAFAPPKPPPIPPPPPPPPPPNGRRAPRGAPPGGTQAIHGASVSGVAPPGMPGRPAPKRPAPPGPKSGAVATPTRTHAKSASAHRQREPFASTSTDAPLFTNATSVNGSVVGVYAVRGVATRLSDSASRVWSNRALFWPVVASTTTNSLPPFTDFRYQKRVGEIQAGACATSTVRPASRSLTAAARR